MTPSNRMLPAVALLALGILGISTASLWIRLHPGPSDDLAFRRLALALPLLVAWTLSSRQRLWPRTDERGRVILSGLFLAAHFQLWIVSLDHLPVATSLILMNTHPIMVLGLELVSRRSPVRVGALVGVLLAVVGASWLVGSESLASEGSRVGVHYALGAAAGLAGYLLVGRSLQRTMAPSSYVVGVYGVAALALAVFQEARGAVLWPRSGEEWQLALLLALFPTVFGHTPLNAALRRLPASVISTAYLGEVVGASLLVWLFLDERPPSDFFGGATLIALGIVLVTVTGGRASRPVANGRRDGPPSPEG